MRIVVFSIIDDWDIGPLIERSGHQVIAWVRPSWHAEGKRSSLSRSIRRSLKLVLAQNTPNCNVVPKYDVREWLTTNKIPMIACENANDPAFCEDLRRYEADLFIVAAYPHIFGGPLLEIPPLGVINYHPSLLPRYAGAQPGFWVLRNAEKVTGITIHRMTEKIDAGDILMQEVVTIERGDNLGHLMQRLHHRAAPLILRTVDAIAKGTTRSQSQKLEERSYFRKKRASDLQLNWNEPSETLLRLLRAVQPFEPLTTRLRGKAIRIFDAIAGHGADVGEPGEIVEKVKDRIVVQTAKGRLEITNFEIGSLHGWMNGMARRCLVVKGDRFDPVPQSFNGNESGDENPAATR